MIFGMLCSMLFVLTGGVAFGQEIDIGPKDITMSTPEEKKPASFPHRKHQDSIACMKCHHTKGQIMTVRKCTICHNINDIKNEELNNLKDAGHRLCRGCHKAYKEETQKGAKNAPLTCRGCHPISIKIDLPNQ